MKHVYRLLIKYPQENQIPYFVFKESVMKTVGLFLWAEIPHQSESTFWLEGLDLALSGKHKVCQYSGNIYCVTISETVTIIENIYAEENDDSYSVIETLELKRNILLWNNELEKFAKIKKEHLHAADPKFELYAFLASHFHEGTGNYEDSLEEMVDENMGPFMKKANKRPYIKKAIALIDQFLKHDLSDEQKNAYIVLCVDAIRFENLNGTPLEWLAHIKDLLAKHLWDTGLIMNTINKIHSFFEEDL